jgi:type IV pilus assembly protein PilP
MIKKIIIFNVIIGFLITSPFMLGCGEEKAKSKKSSKGVSKKIKKSKKPTSSKAAKANGSSLAAAGLSLTNPLMARTTSAYNPEGRVDPFEPLFREEPVAAPVSVPITKKPKGPTRPLTPLEKVDLSQLELKAILRTEAGNKALVEEASGKGYIIKKGTYIGTRSGIVVAILKDRVIVEEEYEDALGKVTIQEKELKLQKPLGEE